MAEGRKPALRVASDVAAAKEETAEYIRFRAFDDGYFCDLILDYLQTFHQGRRADFEQLLACWDGHPFPKKASAENADFPGNGRMASGTSAWYCRQTTPADIRLMTVPDKIRLMEALWKDLSEGDKVVEFPDWHAAVLADRVSRLASGQDTFIDWAVAKKLLREECEQTIQTAARDPGSIRDEMPRL